MTIGQLIGEKKYFNKFKVIYSITNNHRNDYNELSNLDCI